MCKTAYHLGNLAHVSSDSSTKLFIATWLVTARDGKTQNPTKVLLSPGAGKEEAATQVALFSSGGF